MLPKQNRITKQREFDQFFGRDFRKRGGQNISSPYLILKSLPATTKFIRFGFILSNKIDNRAAVRNRIKRQMREIVHPLLVRLNLKRDFLFVVQKEIKKIDFPKIQAEMHYLLQRIR